MKKFISMTLIGLILFMGIIFISCPSKENSTPIPAPTTTPAPAPITKDVILATTTSVQDSGLLDVLVERFNRMQFSSCYPVPKADPPLADKDSGFKIKAIAVGSGEAMAMGKRGDADALLVHSPKDEESFMKEGFGKSHKILMTNYFSLVGPEEDPAGCFGSASAKEAFAKIADTKSIFVSRSDNSGTHKKELSLWKSANITPTGEWYIEAKTGMAIALQVTNEKRGYTLTDRATYLAFKQKLSLKEMLGKDELLLNRYSVIVLNPEKFPKINLAGAEAWANFLLSPDTLKIIGEYGKDKYGESLFYLISK
ncbi:MAG: substrate-binding domain-containing protein [Planctomycetota bacterium]